ncbi:hypothetical protein KAW48_11150, partial [candidate division WOR-3 bacterium]|nr:hypothetical protein [candidate division WOR-3 bacterium]
MKDSIPVWVVEFEVREKVFPKTAVAPLKENGDSVGIIFGVVPPEYFSQDNAPSPDSIVARVYDKDGSLVFGPDTFANHPYPVYYWKGKDNSSKANKAADPDKSPYTVKMRMYYRDDKYVEDEVDIEVIPKLEKSIILTKGVTFNSGASDDKPTSLPMYTFPLHNIEYYGLLYARVLETGNNDNDYKYYTITGQPSEVQVKEGDEIKTVSVEQWNEEIWGELELKWEKVYPYISDDENDVVSYDNRDELEGWEWQNTGQLLPGVHRYMLSIKEKETKQEAEKGKGVDMSIIAALARVIPLMDPDVVDWTESYLGVPYVLGTHPNEYGQDVEKGLHKGYEGIDCSGLACWSFIWAGEPLSSLNPSYP